MTDCLSSSSLVWSSFLQQTTGWPLRACSDGHRRSARVAADNLAEILFLKLDFISLESFLCRRHIELTFPVVLSLLPCKVKSKPSVHRVRTDGCTNRLRYTRVVRRGKAAELERSFAELHSNKTCVKKKQNQSKGKEEEKRRILFLFLYWLLFSRKESKREGKKITAR